MFTDLSGNFNLVETSAIFVEISTSSSWDLNYYRREDEERCRLQVERRIREISINLILFTFI